MRVRRVACVAFLLCLPTGCREVVRMLPRCVAAGCNGPSGAVKIYLEKWGFFIIFAWLKTEVKRLCQSIVSGENAACVAQWLRLAVVV